MVLQDLGRRINTAVSNLTREQNLDEKVQFRPSTEHDGTDPATEAQQIANLVASI